MKSTKKALAILLFCLGVLSIGGSANAATFVEVNRDENVVIYIDTSSLTDKGDYVTAWVKQIPRGELLKGQQATFGKTFSYSLQLKAYKKNDKEVQLLSAYAYDKNGYVMDKYDGKFSPYDFKPIVPNSYGEFIWERVMALIL